MTVIYPPGDLTPNQARRLSEGKEPQITYTCPDGYFTFHLMGPRAPIVGVQEGVTILRESIKGLLAPYQTLDQAGANQDGVTFVDAVASPAEIDMVVEAHGLTPATTRQVIRDWIRAWDIKSQGRLTISADNQGEWYAPVRWLKTPTDPLMRAQSNRQRFLWTSRLDDAFWYGQDSIASRGQGFGQLAFINSGEMPAWPRYLLYGPGYFRIANGPVNNEWVEFGPLLAGQVVLIETDPRRRSIVDISQTQITQQLNQFQEIISALVSFATNNNVPPLLEQFESLFGIRPPQGNLFQYLKGRFTKPVAASLPSGLTQVQLINVDVAEGNSASKIVGAITPRRRWPM